ncbi:hypothetical protein [Neorhizobium sp. NCHU2750]|uniref:lipopolysaccharide biosynthesis protein n=1 Tax=Neorhizobium sp. NCHU2750 TaxID=1825976 RepID=UPI000E723960
MMLTTIPTYFALTDLGFVQAATSEMTMQVASGQRDKALSTFQSSSVLIFVMSLTLAAAILFALVVMGNNVDAFTQHDISLGLITVLCTFAALSLVSRMTLAALRATGSYAIGSIAFDTMTTVEGFAGLLVAYLGGDFLQVALCLMVFRSINLFSMYCMLRILTPWLHYGLGYASLKEAKRLLKPALAAMTIPLALAINLQGVVLIVGAVLSPAAVAVFTPVRTCSRLMIQLVGVVNRATMPELATAFARRSRAQLVNLLKINAAAIACLIVPSCVILGVGGKELVMLWSLGHISADRSFVALVALSTAIHAVWYFASNVLLATNLHVSFAKYSLGASVATLVMVFGLSQVMGLTGTGLALVCGELISLIAIVYVFSRSISILLGTHSEINM